MLGKLKKTINKRCPVCGSVLEVRVVSVNTVEKGYVVSLEDEYICCSNIDCYYEEEIKDKKNRQKKRRRNRLNDLDIES